jgi:predicted enzyme related to lactoylglutathione lyase
MKIRFRHANILAKDWEALARFYEQAFRCIRVPPSRDQAGE